MTLTGCETIIRPRQGVASNPGTEIEEVKENPTSAVNRVFMFCPHEQGTRPKE